MPELSATAPPVPATPIGELKQWQIDIRCSGCRRYVTLRVEDLARRHGETLRIGPVIRSLRCSDARCRARPSQVILAEVRHYGKSLRKVREIVVLGR